MDEAKIPDEWVEVGARALATANEQNGAGPWDFYSEDYHNELRNQARAVLAATLEKVAEKVEAIELDAGPPADEFGGGARAARLEAARIIRGEI